MLKYGVRRLDAAFGWHLSRETEIGKRRRAAALQIFLSSVPRLVAARLARLRAECPINSARSRNWNKATPAYAQRRPRRRSRPCRLPGVPYRPAGAATLER